MKNLRWCVLPLLTVLPLVGPGCATKTEVKVVPVMQSAPTWTKTELYFPIGDWMETALSTEGESRWAAFLDNEVTPRFPEGVKGIEVYGQSISPKAGSPVSRERSRLVVILHPATKEASDKIEEIRAAWKKPGGAVPVLRISEPADVGF
jgi:hypothetical protein